ncbi:MAG TPA: hypothetical protein VE869_06490 [Gemmatimonas sp.]|nr:hypothetical protein [Gemmatimonas sp.]
MTSKNRGGDDSDRQSARGNQGNQEARDLGETGQFEDDTDREGGATGKRPTKDQLASSQRSEGNRNDSDRGVGNNTDGVVGGSEN